MASCHSSRSNGLALFTSTPIGPSAAVACGSSAWVCGFVGEVGRQQRGAATEAADRLAGRDAGVAAGVAVHGDVEAGLRQRERDGAADALRRAGDQGGARDGRRHGRGYAGVRCAASASRRVRSHDACRDATSAGTSESAPAIPRRIRWQQSCAW